MLESINVNHRKVHVVCVNKGILQLHAIRPAIFERSLNRNRWLALGSVYIDALDLIFRFAKRSDVFGPKALIACVAQFR